MAGLGSVPLGRWHDPGRDGWSGRCRPSEKARSESTYRLVFVPYTNTTSRKGVLSCWDKNQTTRGRLRSRLVRRSAPAAAAVPPGVMPPPKWHSSEPGHHSGVAYKCARRLRARDSDPAGDMRGRRSQEDCRAYFSCSVHLTRVANSYAHSLGVKECAYLIKSMSMCRLLRSRGVRAASHALCALVNADCTELIGSSTVGPRARTRQPRLRQLRVRYLSSAECRPAHG